ncbi:MAG: hypothetical protein NVS2B3_07710 [Vulcanimicrobiaceae bacterium]
MKRALHVPANAASGRVRSMYHAWENSMDIPETVTRVVDGAKHALEHLHLPDRDAREDPLEIIKADHERVSALFKIVLADERIASSKARATVAEIVRELEAHAKMEEKLFYPALRARTKATGDDRQTILEAVEEHGSMKDLLRKIKRSTGRDETLRAKLQVLSEIVEHHVREEEEQMFPEAHRLLGEKRLADLGAAMATFKAKGRGTSASSKVSKSSKSRRPSPKTVRTRKVA